MITLYFGAVIFILIPGLIAMSIAQLIADTETAIAAAKGETTAEPAYPCEMCGVDVGDAKNLHRALAHDGVTYRVCDDCAHQHHRWQEVY